MKNLKFLLTLLVCLAVALVLSNCNPEEDDPAPPAQPTITFDDIDASFTGFPGDTAVVTGTIVAPGGLNVYRVTPVINGTRGQTTEVPRGSTIQTNVNFSFNYVLDATMIGQTVSLDFQAVDEDNQIANDQYDIVVEERPISAKLFSVVLLAAPLDDETSQTFFTTDFGQTYSVKTVNDTSANISQFIDFGYYYLDGAQTANLAAPASYLSAIYDLSPTGENWAILRATTFRTVTDFTVSNFNELTASSGSTLQSVYAGGTDTNDAGIITDLQVDQVFAFATDPNKTGGSKTGLIQVVSITPGDGVSGQIELKIWVEE